ncbi:hypothetical protein SAMN06265218_11097 [Fodinibius sediminis]|uniref:Uncharacterized protein n=1 Tax=Fodinibius sediminis TaxID=1214077 RepID=A0A521DHT6_9BACT|nr:hypothetical protein SAMN06265218_11097 [Fodinibius sediminis]
MAKYGSSHVTPTTNGGRTTRRFQSFSTDPSLFCSRKNIPNTIEEAVFRTSYGYTNSTNFSPTFPVNNPYRPLFAPLHTVTISPCNIKKAASLREEEMRLNGTCYSFSEKAESKAAEGGEKSISFTYWQDSSAPNSRSMPLSSHSIESGPR